MDHQALKVAEFKRILLIKLSALGDVVHTFAVLNKLRNRYPRARIDWLIKPSVADLVRHHPAVSNVILFPDQELRKPWAHGGEALAGVTRLFRTLREPHYDLVIDMHGQFRTAVAARFAGAPVRIGFDRPRRSVRAASDRNLPAAVYRHAWIGAREGSWLAYTHHIPLDTLDLHAADRYLRLGLLLGFDDKPADFSFVIPADAAQRAERLLSEHGIAAQGPASRFVLLAPGSVWETKQWPPEKFAAVARHCLAAGTPAVLVGAANEAEACATIAAAAPGVVNLCGQTSLLELTALTRRCAIAVTNDSGPMHLANALGRPTVSVFGPTDSLWAGPYRHRDKVIEAGVPCAPCYLRRLKDCPYNHRCMHLVNASLVIAAVDEVLRSTSGARP